MSLISLCQFKPEQGMFYLSIGSAPLQFEKITTKKITILKHAYQKPIAAAQILLLMTKAGKDASGSQPAEFVKPEQHCLPYGNGALHKSLQQLSSNMHSMLSKQ